MRKILLAAVAFSISVLSAHAAVGDAFKGIWPVTDKSVMKSLNGTWNLKVVPGIDATDRKVPQQDSSWGTIPVPGCWEAYGFCKPSYSYPDSLTGYYRTEFTVPAEWSGQRVCVRFDGVLRGYDLWINDRLVGNWELAYNTCIFDLTPYLTKKAFKGEPQKLSMRVYSQFPGYEFDCYDDWAPMGIFRDVTLFAVPKTHLSDLTVQTKTDGTVTVKTEVANRTKQTTVDYEIMDANGKVVSTGGKIASPILWTPETPYLYTLRVRVKEKGKTLQTFEQKIGLREIKIENGKVLTVNGKPVKLRGVTTHATDPKTVKVISDELTLKDMKLMKEASVNYIRTSHYPREPRFFELCDSLGFYVMCEVSFGSRGKEHLKDTAFFDNLKTRTKATFDRHKNYPSVVAWSLGNENPLTDMCVSIGEYAKSLDATRPLCYPQTNGTMTHIGFGRFPKIADIYAPHYPSTDQVRNLFPKSNRPVIFTEYLHSLGMSFEDHDRQWEIIEQTPCLAGGSVWEWVDQGMPFRKHRDSRYGYEERVYTSQDGGFEMNGNKGTDGLLYADRTPLPNYYELQRNYAQAFIADSTVCCNDNADIPTVTMTVRNRYDFLNLKDNVSFHWTLTNGHDTIAQGAFSPDCAPHSSVRYMLSLPTLPSGSLAILNVETRNSQGWTLLRQAWKLKEQDYCPNYSAGSIEPLVRVGRKPTLAEVMKVNKARVTRYLQPVSNKYVKADIKQDGPNVSYTLTPDTTSKRYFGELGVAYLLPQEVDRVQWLGQGPYPTCPGRNRANRYGIWTLHKDDLYFEGNRMGVEACWLSDKYGNGVLISGDSLNISFEQTDKGIVVTVNAAVSGMCPKFGSSPFGVWSQKVGVLTGTFQFFETKAGQQPAPFASPASVPAAFRPFYTQYDTYLMKLGDITPEK